MKKFFLFLMVLVVVCVIVIYQYLDILAKHAIEKYGSEALGVSVQVRSVSIDLVKAQYTIHGIVVANPHGFSSPYLFEIAELETKIDYRTLFKNVFHIYYIRIEKPKIAYELAVAGDNIQALRNSTKPSSSASKGDDQTAHKVIIEKFFFNKGQVTAGIQKVGEKVVTLPDIYIQNIGKDKNGVTVQSASDQVLRELSKAIAQANVKGLLSDFLSKDKIKGQVDKLLGNFK